MKIDEFKTRWLRHYVEPSLFYLPVEKKALGLCFYTNTYDIANQKQVKQYLGVCYPQGYTPPTHSILPSVNISAADFVILNENKEIVYATWYYTYKLVNGEKVYKLHSTNFHDLLYPEQYEDRADNPPYIKKFDKGKYTLRQVTSAIGLKPMEDYEFVVLKDNTKLTELNLEIYLESVGFIECNEPHEYITTPSWDENGNDITWGIDTGIATDETGDYTIVEFIQPTCTVHILKYRDISDGNIIKTIQSIANNTSDRRYFIGEPIDGKIYIYLWTGDANIFIHLFEEDYAPSIYNDGHLFQDYLLIPKISKDNKIIGWNYFTCNTFYWNEKGQQRFYLPYNVYYSNALNYASTWDESYLKYELQTADGTITVDLFISYSYDEYSVLTLQSSYKNKSAPWVEDTGLIIDNYDVSLSGYGQTYNLNLCTSKVSKQGKFKYLNENGSYIKGGSQYLYYADSVGWFYFSDVLPSPPKDRVYSFEFTYYYKKWDISYFKYYNTADEWAKQNAIEN